MTQSPEQIRVRTRERERESEVGQVNGLVRTVTGLDLVGLTSGPRGKKNLFIISLNANNR
jgi:hypothetical protein